MLLIRRAEASDAEAIAGVHVAAIREVCAARYPAAQIDAWARSKRPSRYLEAIASKPFYVAELSHELVGFGQLEPRLGEIQALYVRPDHLRRGIGSQLLVRLENAARELALTQVVLKSSLNATPFYEANGYVSGAAASICLALGVELACVHMRKELSG